MARINETINPYFVREKSDHTRPNNNNNIVDEYRRLSLSQQQEEPSTRSFTTDMTGLTSPTMDDMSTIASLRDECESLIKQERDANTKREQGARSARRALYSLLREEQQKRTTLEDMVQKEREERLRERQVTQTQISKERRERLKEKEERKALEAKIEYLMKQQQTSSATTTLQQRPSPPPAAAAASASSYSVAAPVATTTTTTNEDAGDFQDIQSQFRASLAKNNAAAAAAAATTTSAVATTTTNKDDGDDGFEDMDARFHASLAGLVASNNAAVTSAEDTDDDDDLLIRPSFYDDSAGNHAAAAAAAAATEDTTKFSSAGPPASNNTEENIPSIFRPSFADDSDKVAAAAAAASAVDTTNKNDPDIGVEKSKSTFSQSTGGPFDVFHDEGGGEETIREDDELHELPSIFSSPVEKRTSDVSSLDQKSDHSIRLMDVLSKISDHLPGKSNHSSGSGGGGGSQSRRPSWMQLKVPSIPKFSGGAAANASRRWSYGDHNISSMNMMGGSGGGGGDGRRPSGISSRKSEVEATIKALLQKEREESDQLGKSMVMDEEELMNLVQVQLDMKQAEDEKWHEPFGESTYAMLYMSRRVDQGFWFALVVWFIQMATITLTLIDVVDRDNKENPLQVPAMVEKTVTAAQAVTIFMLLAFMSDLMEAVMKLQDGFYPEILDDHPGATFPKWLFSCLAQLSAGLLLLVTSFILTMQSATVIDLMLNMTALLFMAEIDDLSFVLALHGFFTDKLEMQADSVANFKFPKRRRRNLYRRILFGIILAFLFAGYGIIKQREMYGYYLPTYIYVQFGDAYNPRIPYYSGLMKANDVKKQGYREYRDLGTENILLTHCKSENAWTFTDNDDPCDFFAKTTDNKEYDVTTIPDSEWLVADAQGRLHPFAHFSLVDRDCNLEFCKGTCVDGLCECPHDQFGMDCEFSLSNVCPTVILDTRFGPFPPATLDYNGNLTKFAVSDEFDILKNTETDKYVKVYDMPVYYSNRTFPANVIFFGGRRWIFTSEWDLIEFWAEAHNSNMTEMFFPQKTVEVLQRSDFHAFKGANYTPIFFSDPVDFETPDFLPTPSNLGWWSARIRSKGETQNEYEPDYELETRMTCQSCLASQGGYCDSAGGTCNETTGRCECQSDYFGDKCELQPACYEQDLPCNGQGVCDHNSGECTCHSPWYNKLCFWFQLCINEDGQCQNGGECDELTWECKCPPDPALDGITCERYLDCRVNGCANGGICGQDGKCLCRPPFHGILCNLVDTSQKENFCSDDSDCMNGSCDTATGVCTCNDPASYGTRCEHSYGCWWGGCRNGGTCTESGVCACVEPFFGPDCSQEPVCTDDAYCVQHFGRDTICDAYTGTCMCGVPGPRSKRCFSRAYNCKQVGCNNRGTCMENGRCECRFPFAGRQCEYGLEEFYSDQSEFKDMYYAMLDSCLQENGWPPYPPEIRGCYYLFG